MYIALPYFTSNYTFLDIIYHHVSLVFSKISFILTLDVINCHYSEVKCLSPCALYMEVKDNSLIAAPNASMSKGLSKTRSAPQLKKCSTSVERPAKKEQRGQ